MAKKLKSGSVAEKINIINDATKQDKNKEEETNFIPIDSIIFNDDNVFNLDDSDESIQELANNIKENGLLHNIVVAEIEPSRYLLISGERRTRAVKYLGQDKIKATIRKNLSEFEILKMLFFANSETREYTIEEKVQIIEGFLVKIKQFEHSEKKAATKFKEYVAQAFNVSERQAHKLISITSELIAPLKDMLYSDAIDINTAAALAQLPSGYQEYAVDIIKPSIDKNKEEQDYAIERALDFAKRAKNIISKTNSSLAKQKASNVYYSGRLVQAKEELAKIDKELEASDLNDDQVSELTIRKLNAEKDVAKYNATLAQIDKDVDIETQKQNSEVKKVYDVTFCSVGKGLDDVQKDKTGVIAQSKMIDKEIHKADKAIEKLLAMKPSEELKEIQNLLSKFRNKYCV